MLLKKPIIGCVSLLLLLLGHQTADSCGWYPASEEYRFCVFNPFVVPQPELSPFVFTTDKFLYNFTTDGIYDPVYRTNVNEWAAYTHNNVPQKEIYHVLYNFDPLKFINYSGTLAQTNSFMKYLHEHDKKAFDYVVYAKRCEQVLNKPDPWGDYFDFDIDMDAAVRLINEGEIMYNDTKSDFLRLHIAYQLEKLFFYETKPVAGVNDDKRTIYKEKITKSKVDSWIKNSAFYYYTITEWDSLSGYKNSAEQGCALAKAFDKAPDKRFRCVQLFDRRLKGALALAKTNHDKALLNIMYQLQNSGSGLNGLQTIYALEPTSQYIPFLLTREVNKLEDWLETDKMTNMEAASFGLRTDIPENEKDWNTRTDYTAARRRKDMEYLDKVIAFINQLNSEKKQPNSGLLSLMASHLYIIKGDTLSAKQALDMAAREPASDVIKKQIAVTQFMLRVTSNALPDAETEQLIMQLCKTKRTKYDDDKFYEEDVPQPPMEDQLILFAGRKMMEKGNYAKGLLLLNKTQCLLGMDALALDEGENIYQVLMESATAKEYKQLVEFIDKKDKTPFEKFLMLGKIYDYPGGFLWYEDKEPNLPKRPIYNRPINKYKVLDYEATWYMNHDSLEQAYAALAQIPDYYWNREPYNFFKDDDPFTVSYLSTRQDTAVRGEKHWNKRTILKRILQLKQEAETNPKKRAEDYLLLGNAYYSFSYYGKYWIMNRISWSGAEPGAEVFSGTKFTPFDEMYYGTNLAKKYYMLGAQSGGSKATVARCYYMAGACKENYDRLLWQMDARHEWDDFVVKNAHPYMNLFKQFLHTSADKKEVEDTTGCTMYRDFLDVAFKK